MWYVCDVLYAVMYVCVSCFVLRRCAASRRYIDVCYWDMCSVVNVYVDHLETTINTTHSHCQHRRKFSERISQTMDDVEMLESTTYRIHM